MEDSDITYCRFFIIVKSKSKSKFQTQGLFLEFETFYSILLEKVGSNF